MIRSIKLISSFRSIDRSPAQPIILLSIFFSSTQTPGPSVSEDPSNLVSPLLALLHRFIPHELRGVSSPSQLSLSRLSGALTNVVYLVRCPPYPSDEREEEQTGWRLFPRVNWQGRPASRKLILRIYGVGVDRFVQRDRELVWMNRLSRMNVGPKLVGCFGNGRLEEFVDSDTLTSPQVREPATSVQIAAEMARFHLVGSSGSAGGRGSAGSIGAASPELRGRSPRLDAKSPKIDPLRSPRIDPLKSPALNPRGAGSADGSEIWSRLDSWFTLAADAATELSSRSSSESKILEKVGSWKVWKDEVEWIKKVAGKVASPVVFSHNDLQYGNILRRKGDGSLMV